LLIADNFTSDDSYEHEVALTSLVNSVPPWWTTEDICCCCYTNLESLKWSDNFPQRNYTVSTTEMVWARCKYREMRDTPKWPGKLECRGKDPKTPTD